MSYAELIQLYFERSNALQWYWTIYVVVIGGLLAFSSLRTRKDFITGILVTVLFIGFAYKNHGAIQDVTAQRGATLQVIHQYQATASTVPDIKQAREFIEPTLIAQEPKGIRKFHVACDVLTIAALWAMELRRIRNARSEVSRPV